MYIENMMYNVYSYILYAHFCSLIYIEIYHLLLFDVPNSVLTGA